jgi:DNA invertase Pin-like site-specific DNA recombinase
MKRCAIYARYSSDLQSPASIDDQLDLCRRAAQQREWVVVAEFHDAALSGFGVEHRPGYQQLLKAAFMMPPVFDIILVEDLSRLTRDTGELLRLNQRLRLRDIEIVGVSDGIATGRQGAKVQLTVKGLFNELYLDDLREKTHRGLAGRVARGMSAGGRIFGYRTAPVADENGDTRRHSAPARFEIEPGEAAIVRRIFADHARGQSLAAVAHALNREGVPFPAKDTKRGPARRGWAVSTIQVILHNEKYVGVWIWNKTRYVKDPDTGRRRPVARPEVEWTRQERPDLRIIDPDLWRATQERLALVEKSFGVGPGRPPRGGAHVAYSRHLLSGLVRCGYCGARMITQTATRRKGADVYRYGWYRCGFAKDKGPAVCTHRTGYRQDRLERALLDKFREAMRPEIVDAVVAEANVQIKAAFQRTHARPDEIRAEILRLEGRAGNLVRFVANGDTSPMVRKELETLEAELVGLRVELAEIGTADRLAQPQVHRTWVMAKLERLDHLLRTDPARARVEIAKHLDGDLTLLPRPGGAGERRAEIRGRVKSNSLLEGQEAVCLQVVAGVGFEPTTFGL